jgi:hypothetical protein
MSKDTLLLIHDFWNSQNKISWSDTHGRSFKVSDIDPNEKITAFFTDRKGKAWLFGTGSESQHPYY